ncbi:sorbose reductase sou1 [Earliella scabrosa]|nr:sorbose reductase sou1 [Earliella scabrosa]
MFFNSSSLRAASAVAGQCARARFATSALLKSASARGRMTGPLPPYGPVGVAKALEAPASAPSSPTLFEHEFSLADRVGFVTGGNRGIGLEMALALVEAGSRVVYCVDLPKKPGEEFTKVREYVSRTQGTGGDARLEYISADVTDQDAMWKVGRTIGDREGKMDVCVAAAGILRGDTDGLTYPAKQFKEVMAVNVNGVLYTAQAAGQQMDRFGNGGSIIMIASISGHGYNQGHPWASYNTSKSAVLQLARSMACELGPKKIRVNTISPGYINTSMTGQFLAKRPELLEAWSSHNPMGRIGRPDELRGIVAWLASDASSFCTGSDILVSGGHHAW